SVYLLRRPPTPPLFPYTTLFRSVAFHVNTPDERRSVHKPPFSSPPRAAPLPRAARQWTPPGKPSSRRRSEMTPGCRRRRRSRRRSEEHTSELQSRENLVCRLLLE